LRTRPSSRAQTFSLFAECQYTPNLHCVHAWILHAHPPDYSRP
jgi:hypothetical protein